MNPLLDIIVVKILQLNIWLVRPLVDQVIVICGFVNVVAVEYEPRIALETFVSNAQPISSRVDDSFIAINEAGMNDQRSTALTPNERPSQRAVNLTSIVSSVRRVI